MQIDLNFTGYFPEYIHLCKKYSSGIYVVYSGVSEKNICHITNVLYIGESDHICCDIKKHPQKNEWYENLKPGEELFLSVCPLEKSEKRTRALIALIHQTRPLCNLKYVSKIPVDDALINLKCTGNSDLL